MERSPQKSFYMTFEALAESKLLRGRDLDVLEFNTIKHKLYLKAKMILGQEKIEQLFPSSDLVTAQQWQKETGDSLKIINLFGQVPLFSLNDIRPALSYASSQGVLEPKALLSIGLFLKNVDNLKRYIKDFSSHSNQTDNAFVALVTGLIDLPSLSAAIDFAILGEEEINDRASEGLFRVRQQLKQSQLKIKALLEKVISSHSQALQEGIVTIRNDRYVVPVKADRRSEVPGIIHDRSASGQTIFVEPLSVVENNNLIRQFMDQEKEEIWFVLKALTDLVYQQLEALREDIHFLTEIDFLQAKAMLAKEMEANEPVLNDQGIIHLRKARHPLIDPQKVVPIDFRVGQEYKTLVITGPNTGGKTVALKTCGLFVLMAMAGLFIPALDHSEISVFQSVLADIGDEQSIEQSLSTFSSHMRNIIDITQKADKSTLILVDELGSGTDPSEGAALAIAILDYWRQKGAVTVATTHYKELKGYAIKTEEVENACCEFDVETLSPTYRLLIGMPGVSNAFSISHKLGLPQDIISQAQKVLSEDSLQFEELLASVQQNNLESEKLKAEIRQMRNFVKTQEKSLMAAKAQLETEKIKILQQTRDEQQEMLEAAFIEVDDTLKSFKQLMQAEDKQAAKEKMEAIRQNLRLGLKNLDASVDTDIALGKVKSSSMPGKSPAEVLQGGFYYSTSLGKVGTVISASANKKKCVFQVDNVKFTVDKNSLLLPTKEQIQNKNTLHPVANSVSKSGKDFNPYGKRKEKTSAGTIKAEKTARLMPELKLIGLRAEEALHQLDRYLDDCVLGNLSSVRIVHGKGSGALRSVVADFLRQDSRVISFRLGAFGEGEDGVTIATLK